MIKIKAHILSFIFFICTLIASSQSTNYALKTPETLEIIEIELGSEATLVKLSIENRVKEGYFCADKNTYLITDQGFKIKLERAIGIPICPQIYKFKAPGEKLYFTLHFPALPIGTSWIDLIEECGEMCFSVYGITLDPVLNKQIDEGFSKLDAGMTDEAILKFESLLSTLEGTNQGILGSIYLNLITLYENQGRDQESKEIYEKLLKSNIPHKELFLQNTRK